MAYPEGRNLEAHIHHVEQQLFADASDVASIRLHGFPYEQIQNGEGINSTDTLHTLAGEAGYRENVHSSILAHEQDLVPLRTLGFHGLDKKVKSPKPLTYEEAFSLMSYVSMSSNAYLYNELAATAPGFDRGLLEPDVLRLHSVSLLQGMSTREALIGLSPDEIAGMVAATIELDTVVRTETAHDDGVFVLGGMGGDRGLRMNGHMSKLFSVSTLSALTLGEYGSVHKHHSYPNTSKVAGQSAIEALGARSDFSTPEALNVAFARSNVLMTSCHNTRTIHTLSHVLKGETVNHVIGPAAFPHSNEDTLHGVIGVNHNVHPETYIEALGILRKKGILAFDSSVAFCGIDQKIGEVPDAITDAAHYAMRTDLKDHVALDEVPPPPYTTLASFLVNGENAGSYLIEPLDFMDEEGLSHIPLSSLLIPNEESHILNANDQTIKGHDEAKVRYVAMTVALSLFTKEYAHLPEALDLTTHRIHRGYLREAYDRAYKTLKSGDVEERKNKYVEATQKEDLFPGVDVIILDIDGTLVHPKHKDFYSQYGGAVHRAIGAYAQVSQDKAITIAQSYRASHGGGEMALFSGTIGENFPEVGDRLPNTAILYDELCTIDPTGEFSRHSDMVALLKTLKAQGKTIVALTDSPRDLSKRILKEAGINPETDFDYYLAYEPEVGSYKKLYADMIFKQIASHLGVAPERMLSIGDSLVDVEVPNILGMRTCLLGNRDTYEGLQATNLFDAIRQYKTYYQLEREVYED